MALSIRDRKILQYLQRYDAEQNGAPAPSYREIVAGCQLTSTAQVKDALHNLSDAGLVKWYPGVARSIRLANDGAGNK